MLEGFEGGIIISIGMMKMYFCIICICLEMIVFLEDKRWWILMEELLDMDRVLFK